MATVNFLWNPVNDNIVKELDESGNTLVDYTTEPGVYGNIVSQHRSGQSSFFHAGGIGSITAVTDITGSITNSQSYSAFGETIEHTGITDYSFKFIGQQGYYTDSATGSVQVRERPYQPEQSRWAVPDPIDELSQYIYADNCPVSKFDPSGLLCAEPPCSAEDKCSVPFCSASLHSPFPDEDWTGYHFTGVCPSEALMKRHLALIRHYIINGISKDICKDVSEKQIEQRLNESGWDLPGPCRHGCDCKPARRAGGSVIVKDAEGIGDVDVTFYYQLTIGGIVLTSRARLPHQKPCHVKIKNVVASVGYSAYLGGCSLPYQS